MWSESQRTALAQISEDDKIAATAVPWRYLTGPAQVILETPEKQASGWQWQAAVGLGAWFYRRRRVPAATVLAQLDRVMTGLENEARSASLDRTVPIDQWALRMAGISETSALVAGAFAAGGWARLDVVLGDVEEHLAAELGYLDAFADDVAAGRVPRDGRFLRRAMLYGAAGWGFYMLLRGREARRRGYGEEHNILDPGAEHCQECVGETDRGWQPLGSLIPVGSRQCRSGCRCRMEYRNAAGEVAE